MPNRIYTLILIIISITFSTAIFCQIEDNTLTTPDTAAVAVADTVGVISLTTDFLHLLIDNDFIAADEIAWESLMINGTDYSEDYWDAYDWEEEDYFMEEVVATLSDLINPVAGDAGEFVDWSIISQDNLMLVKCHNNAKRVELILSKNTPVSIYVSDINIADIPKE